MAHCGEESSTSDMRHGGVQGTLCKRVCHEEVTQELEPAPGFLECRHGSCNVRVSVGSLLPIPPCRLQCLPRCLQRLAEPLAKQHVHGIARPTTDFHIRFSVTAVGAGDVETALRRRLNVIVVPAIVVAYESVCQHLHARVFCVDLALA